MPTPKQLEAQNLYAAIMEEVKVRILLIETAIQGKLFIHSQLVKELSYLQLRLICELIALGCLVVHGDIKSTREKRFLKEYDASKIIAGLEDLHPNFYPLPITVHFDAVPRGHHTTPITSGFLSKRELLSLYGKSGDHLHRGSIKKLLKPKSLDVLPNSYPDIWEWLKKLGTLLNTHQISLLGGQTHFLCIMSAANIGGGCQVAIAEAALPPPELQSAFDARITKS